MMVTSRRRRRRRGRGRHGSQLSAGTCRSRWRLYRPALSDGTSAEPPLCLPLNVLYSLLMRRPRGCYDKRGNLYMLKRLSDRNRVFELSVVLFCLVFFFSMLSTPSLDRSQLVQLMNICSQLSRSGSHGCGQ